MASIYYNPVNTTDRDDIGWYYKYVIQMLQMHYNGNKNVELEYIDRNKKNISIAVQCEHTLVDSYAAYRCPFVSKYGVNGCDRRYSVRIDKIDYLFNYDVILDYSIPNYKNIESNSKLKLFLDKTYVIHPCVLNRVNLVKDNRSGIITSFSNFNTTRRENIFNTLTDKYDDIYSNINVYNFEKQLEIYNRSKILVNIHQTDYHHTFEEFRVLPILQSGVIIIAEKSPLSEYIPYHEHIIWVDYNDIEYVVNDVYTNYAYYHNKIFNNKLIDIINVMQNNNENKIKEIYEKFN